MTRGAHLDRARCARCGGLLGQNDAPHAEGCGRGGQRMTRVLVSLDAETLEALKGINPNRSEAIRTAARAYVA